MPTNAPAVDRALKAYARSLDFGQLNNEAKEVVQAIRSNAYNDCLEELRLLFVKITLKSCFLQRFQQRSNAMRSFAESNKRTHSAKNTVLFFPLKWGKEFFPYSNVFSLI